VTSLDEMDFAGWRSPSLRVLYHRQRKTSAAEVFV
jgi:hypothetical protein